MTKVESKTKKTFEKLRKIIGQERDDFIVFLIYTVISGLLYLAVPVSAQILVNTIASNILIQPLVLLSVVLFVVVLVLGLVRIIQLFIAEILQRKIFAKVSLKIAEHLPELSPQAINSSYTPELANRFFDVISIQKNLSALLLEVPSACLQILVGLLLMAFYNPVLLFLDSFLVVSIIFIGFLGRNGIETSIKESTSKYSIAYWLEEIARSLSAIKLNGSSKFFVDKTDEKVSEYIKHRKKHFKVLLGQYIASFSIQAIATVSVLAVGGWLVLEGKLSLGQLVASELIILIILNSLEKITHKLESFYDLLTSLYKVSQITDIKSERLGGNDFFDTNQGAKIEAKNLNFYFDEVAPTLKNISFSLEPRSTTSLIGVSGSGKTTLANLIAGLYIPTEGKVFINDQSTDGIDLSQLRSQVAFISNYSEIFDGTVEENITIGKEYSKERLYEVLDMVMMTRDLKLYKHGLKTKLISEGRNISLGQRQRILLARAIISEPEILILDEVFGGMDEATKLQIAANLFDPKHKWTILNISHDAHTVCLTKNILVLEEGEIIESGELESLYSKKDSHFRKIFPQLQYRLNNKGDA